MPFRPQIGDRLAIDDVTYRIAEHPAAPGMPHGQEGRAGIVCHLLASGKGAVGEMALKVFKPRFRLPFLVSQAKKLAVSADLPGMQAVQDFERGLLIGNNKGALFMYSMGMGNGRGNNREQEAASSPECSQQSRASQLPLMMSDSDYESPAER